MRVLAYHRVEPPRDLSWNRVSPGRFERQMELLRREGFRGVPLRELLRSGGEREVAITFDDGLASAVRHALPVLARIGFQATIFVPTAWIGRPNRWDSRLVGRPVRHAAWEELEEAAAAGWEIGSHGHTHRDLTTLAEEEARAELETSRALLAGRIGNAPESIAYPFGRTNDRVARLAREAGYARGCISFMSRAARDPWRIGRSGVRLFDGDADFLAKVRGGPLETWQAAKDRLAHLFSLGTPRLFHRIRKVDVLC
ncbi:MAG: polysaccharide deacetylase family protein [Candidatus Eisenbacteria bacterium]|nr:polysaccharide deacetylase family protein [Candidatus Eisenbacteria bacterium]